jgi:radical SAM superfamily enzyme YgiQ (UPF0313 family)
MRKPGRKLFERFIEVFEAESKKAGKPQFIIPYLMTAFPGCTDKEMRELTDWLGKRGWQPQQVQCFIPLPGTMAAAMFYAGVDWHGNPVKVAKTDAERMRQHYQLVKPVGDEKKHPHLNSPSAYRSTTKSGRSTFPPAFRGRRDDR